MRPFDPDHQLINANFELALAEKEIYENYGDRVSIWDKSKTLIKFGENTDLDADVKETIWNRGGYETYVFANEIDRVVSTSASDTISVVIEGHTNSGTELVPVYTFLTQTVTLTGQTPVALTTPISRVSRLSVSNHIGLAGDVAVFEDSAVVSGSPSDITKVHLLVSGTLGHNSSHKAATTFSDTDYFILTEVSTGVRRKATASVDFTLEVREGGRVFVPRLVWSSTQSGTTISLHPYLIVPKNADVRIVGTSAVNNTAVAASFSGFLASVVA